MGSLWVHADYADNGADLRRKWNFGGIRIQESSANWRTEARNKRVCFQLFVFNRAFVAFYLFPSKRMLSMNSNRGGMQTEVRIQESESRSKRVCFQLFVFIRGILFIPLEENIIQELKMWRDAIRSQTSGVILSILLTK
jgi:hypothetical protein